MLKTEDHRWARPRSRCHFITEGGHWLLLKWYCKAKRSLWWLGENSHCSDNQTIQHHCTIFCLYSCIPLYPKLPCGCYKKKGKCKSNTIAIWQHIVHCFTTREEGVVGLELAGYDFNIEVSAHQIDQLNKIWWRSNKVNILRASPRSLSKPKDDNFSLNCNLLVYDPCTKLNDENYNRFCWNIIIIHSNLPPSKNNCPETVRIMLQMSGQSRLVPNNLGKVRTI